MEEEDRSSATSGLILVDPFVDELVRPIAVRQTTRKSNDAVEERLSLSVALPRYPVFIPFYSCALAFPTGAASRCRFGLRLGVERRFRADSDEDSEESGGLTSAGGGAMGSLSGSRFTVDGPATGSSGGGVLMRFPRSDSGAVVSSGRAVGSALTVVLLQNLQLPRELSPHRIHALPLAVFPVRGCETPHGMGTAA